MYVQVLTMLTVLCLVKVDCTGKPGYCPTLEPHMAGTCVQECDQRLADTDCADNLKCCSNGCGHTCQKVSQTREKLSALNITVALDIHFSKVDSNRTSFITAVKYTLENGYPQFFTFDPSQIDVVDISSVKNGDVTKVNMLISQGSQSDHDFSVYSGELRVNIDLGRFQVDYDGNKVSQVKEHSDFYYMYTPVDDTGSGQNIHSVTVSVLLMALLALLYLI